MKKKIRPQVRVGICAGPDLLPEWEELFTSNNYFVVDLVAPSHKVLLEQLGATSDYYHVVLFIDCHVALKSNGKLLQQLR
ncbi:MAG: hypothetical protein J7497_03465 [Chitinophagaceae bacterium]|nr:hypothetical protein [Chitinophagaceae bacterium]